MRIVVAPDKFKGSLSAAQVARHVANGLRAARPAAEVIAVPVADGGDGTVDAALAAGFERVTVCAGGPAGERQQAVYARGGELAVVELAGVCGLSRLRCGVLDPLGASSFGVGEVLAAALDAGAERVVLGIGGSASTDGGTGMLQALGACVLDGRGRPLARGGGALADAVELHLDGLHPRLHDIELTVAGDVANPLCGPGGAAVVYGPQKGASPAQVATLDAGLRHWARVAARATGVDRSGAPGAGAAGGVGFAALALGAAMRPGIEVVLDLLGFDALLLGADLVITGEGSLDEQTLSGKAPAGVAAAAIRAGVPVIAVAGRLGLDGGQLTRAGFAGAYALTGLDPDPDRCMREAGPLLERLARDIAATM